ncbi:MAG TPA: transglutaminaseTgpA domain-containing protein [Gaiella sp.]|nr:transglutaminaseTgpA domain-containing protein [Gaiella sp.]
MASGRSLRVAVAAAPAVGTIALAWALLERPASWPGFVIAALLALAPTVPRREDARAAVAVGAVVVALAAVFRTWPHHALAHAWGALHDAPTVRAPFDPGAFPSLHGLVACAAFGLALAAALAVSTRRVALLVAAVAVGVGFPATLLEDAHAVSLGMLALGSVLWATAVLRTRRLIRLVPGLTLAAAVVVAAAAAASGGVAPGETHVDWRGWDPFARGGGTGDFRFVWDASYSGISFPPRPTVLFRVRAPKRAQYWRASTLDTFVADRWIEDLYPVDAGFAERALPPDPLVPARDRKPGAWLRQRVTIDGYRDDHVVAVGEPARVDGSGLGRVSFLSGGVMRAAADVTPGTTYSVWSYAPRPAPRALAASPPRYPAAAARYLELMGRAQFPGFGAPARARRIHTIFSDDRYQPLWAYRPLWRDAERVTARAHSPYEATLLLERWFRSDGNFTYDERPPASRGLPPLVAFVEKTRAGYCQHFAGAMAVMLRMLGIPARVAVGFTAGTWKDGVWTVTDYQAHAWVEAWFAGFGWLTFDPTPGRGTLSAAYTFASDSADAVAALGTGRFLDFDPAFRARPDGRPTPATARPVSDDGVAWWVVAVPVVPAAAAALVLLAKWARRTRRLRRRDPRGLAWGVRAELVGELVDRGVAVEPNATTVALQRTAERALALPCGALAAALAEARYGPPGGAEGASRRAREELRRILAVARSRESPGTRVRCALSLRSLRPGLTPSAR